MTQEKYNWYEPKDPTPREQCPCCDYISLPERGNYLICSVCFWEDDGQNVDDLDGFGPNGCSLRDARENFKKFGSSELRLKQFVCTDEERRRFKYKKQNIDTQITQ
jgi:hypothetical protein